MLSYRGSALLEFIIVICLTALLSRSLAPTLAKLYAHGRLQSSLRTLGVDIRAAQILSMAGNQTLYLSMQSQSYQLTSAKNEIYVKRALAKDIRLLAGSSKQISFYAGGTLSPLTLRLQSAKGSCELIVSLHGHQSDHCDFI